MAFALTSLGTAQAASGQLSVAVGSTLPAGSLIVVIVNDTSSATLLAPTDSAGNTYNVVAQQTDTGGNNHSTIIAYTYNATIAAGGWIHYTCNAGGGGYGASLSAFYATGAATASDPIDAATIAHATSGAASNGSPSIQMAAAPAVANSLVVAALGIATAATLTQPGGGWATPPVKIGTAGRGSSCGGTVVSSSRLTYAPTCVDYWNAIIVAFKPAVVSAIPATPSAYSVLTAGQISYTVGTRAPNRPAASPPWITTLRGQGGGYTLTAYPPRVTGPQTYQAAVVEAAAAADALTAQLVTTASVSEAASAADAPDASLITAASVTEPASAIDAPDATRITAAAVSEAASAATVQDAALGGVSTQTEAASAADAPSASLITAAAVSEAASVADAPAASLITAAAVTEAASAADAPDASLVTAAAVTEAASAADVTAASLIMVAAVIEAAGADAVQDAAIAAMRLAKTGAKLPPLMRGAELPPFLRGAELPPPFLRGAELPPLLRGAKLPPVLRGAATMGETAA